MSRGADPKATLDEVEAERAQQQRFQALLDEVERQAARLRSKNRLLALESEVGLALAGSGTLAAALGACAQSVVEHLDAAYAGIWTYNDELSMLELRASAGAHPELDGPYGRVPIGSFKIGQIAAQREPHVTDDVASGPWRGDPTCDGLLAFAGYPILLADKLVGVIAVFAQQPLAELSRKSLKTVASCLAQAIERWRLLSQERGARTGAEAARAELRSLFMQAPVPIAVLRGETLIYELANEAYMELIGPERQVLGRALRETRTDLEGTGFLEQFESVFATGQRTTGKRKVTFLRDGKPTEGTFDFVMSPFDGLDGRVAGVLLMAFDITDTERARDSIEATLQDRERMLAIAESARRTAELASRAKDEFLATASHELRTPLNAILGWAQLLRKEGTDPAEVARGLETIERNAKIQTQLIEDILDGSRIITGKLHLEIRAIDLNAVVAAAIDTVRPAAAAKGITIDVALDSSAAQMHGDPDRLQQVVWNLLSNAIKFTAKGGKVEVRSTRSGSGIELSVKDNGQGIPRAFVAHVFERFRQADGSTTRRHRGLGLGLALVRHLVEAHGGTVRAESKGEGKGALFTLRLPVLAVSAERPPSDHPRPERTSAPALPPDVLVGLRILVIDDEPDARELVATVLRGRGAEVFVASSVKQALELVELSTPHALVSDIGMPVSDGYALIARLRAMASDAARTPAIALTAYARDQDRSRALEAGFQAHLTKPVDPEALIRVVVDVTRVV